MASHGFRLSCVTCEVSGEDLIIWLNTKNDSLNRLQNTFSPIELEYFQILMREIIISKERCLLYSICASLSTTLTSPLSKTDALDLLTKWNKSGYFVSKNSRLYLGARCIIEFCSYYREHCGDYLNTCSLCSEILFKVRICNVSYIFMNIKYPFRAKLVNTVKTCFIRCASINFCQSGSSVQNVNPFGKRLLKKLYNCLIITRLKNVPIKVNCILILQNKYFCTYRYVLFLCF